MTNHITERAAMPVSARSNTSDLADSLVAVESAITIVRERWKPAILWLIAAGHRRFSALQRALPNATHKMLSQQLQDLVRDGILSRWSAEHGRRHVEYTLTPAGEALQSFLAELEAWGRTHGRQAGCGATQVKLPPKSDEPKPLHVVREQFPTRW